jgi:HSP20 family protein
MANDPNRTKAGRIEQPQPPPYARTGGPPEGRQGGALARPYFPEAYAASPLSLMRRFIDDIDSLFGSFDRGQGLANSLPFGSGMGLAGGQLWSPTVEVFEREGRLIVRADLPGLTEKDVHVHVESDVLTIEGERRHEHQETREGVFHSERSYGSFRRSVRLPEGVDPNAIQASFERGVLEVTMPSPKPRANRHRIDVRGASTTGVQQGAQPARPAEAAQGQTAAQNGTYGPYPRADGPH